MATFFIQHRFIFFWATLLFGVVGVLTYQKMPVELLPRSSERQFTAFFVHQSDTPTNNFLRLKPVIERVLEETIGKSDYSADSNRSRTRFEFKTTNTSRNLAQKIELSVLRKLQGPLQDTPFQVIENSLTELPSAEVLLLAKKDAGADTLRREAERLQSLLVGQPAIGRAQLVGFGQKALRLTQSEGSQDYPQGLFSALQHFSSNSLNPTHMPVGENTILRWDGTARSARFDAEIVDLDHLQSIRYNGQAAAGLLLYTSPTSDEISLGKSLHSVVEAFESPHVDLEITKESATYITEAEANVAGNLIIGTLLTCICILFFVRRFWSTALVAMAIPLTLLLSIPIFHILGISRNVMSLAGVALGVGIVVDASLSTVGSFNQKLRKGFLPTQAALFAARENQKPLLLTSLTTLAVFIPILTLDGMVGDLFTDLSLTVIIGQVVGFFVSVFVTPSVACMLHNQKETHLQIDRSNRNSEEPQGALLSFLRRPLTRFFSSSTLCALFNLALIGVIAINLRSAPPSEFLPIGESHAYSVVVNHAEKLSSLARADLAEKLDTTLKKEGFEKRQMTLGPDQIIVNTQHSGSEANQLNIALTTEKLEETLSPHQVGLHRINPLEPKSALGEDIEFYTSPRDRTKATWVIENLKAQHGVVSVRFSGNHSLRVLSRDQAHSPFYSLWIPPSGEQAVQRLLQEKAPLGRIETDRIEPHAQAQLAGKASLTPVYFDNSEKKHHTLRTSQTIHQGFLEDGLNLSTTSSEVHFIEGKILDKVTIDIDGVTTGEVETALTQLAASQDLQLHWHPTTEASRSGFSKLLVCLLVALVIIALIIFVQNRSIRLVSIVLCTFIWAPIGSIPGLILHDESLNASALVGFILLAGTIVNNGILLVELIEKKRKAQIKPVAACLEAISERAVNVTITSLTTVLGMLPMVFETGAGSQMYRGLSIVVVYGTLASTPISLLGVPSLVIVLGAVREFLSRLQLLIGVRLSTPKPVSRKIPQQGAG